MISNTFYVNLQNKFLSTMNTLFPALVTVDKTMGLNALKIEYS